MAIPRTVIASLVAPLCALVPLLLLAGWEASLPVQVIDGEPDDAPVRSFGLLLTTLPFIYVVMSITAFGLGCALLRVGLFTLKSFLIASIAGAIAMALIVGLLSSAPHVFGVKDTLIAVAAFSVLFFLMFLPGAACWWYIARTVIARGTGKHDQSN
jgi:hypothetical protein